MMNKDNQQIAVPSAGMEAIPVLADVADDLSEASICKMLNRKYSGNCRYKLSNAFVFRNDWESDFFVQKENGYSYEFEIKISRSDFFNDKKKVEKHTILDTGKYLAKNRVFDHNENKWKDVFEEKKHEFRPNKFFYVVPENMITVNELPKYAGLMYVPEKHYKELLTIKEAPFIHKNKLLFENVLCKKFYHYWLDAKKKALQLEFQIESMKLNAGSNYR